MNWFLSFVMFALPISASASTLLECHPRDGKFGVRDIVVGNVVLNGDEVILFQQEPVMETITFDAKKAVQETSRTGSWTTYTYEKDLDEVVITLQLEDSGDKRRAYLTKENSPMADEPFFQIIPLMCFLQK